MLSVTEFWGFETLSWIQEKHPCGILLWGANRVWLVWWWFYGSCFVEMDLRFTNNKTEIFMLHGLYPFGLKIQCITSNCCITSYSVIFLLFSDGTITLPSAQVCVSGTKACVVTSYGCITSYSVIFSLYSDGTITLTSAQVCVSGTKACVVISNGCITSYSVIFSLYNDGTLTSSQVCVSGTKACVVCITSNWKSKPETTERHVVGILNLKPKPVQGLSEDSGFGVDSCKFKVKVTR